MTELLSAPEIVELADAAVEGGLGESGMRSVVLGGVNSQFVVSQIPAATLPPRPQQIADLQILNRYERLTDGSTPLQGWLLRAEGLAQGEKPLAVIKAALAKVGRLSGGVRAVPDVEEPPEFEEKIVYRDDMLPVGFLAGGVSASRSVAKLEVHRHENGAPRHDSAGNPYLFLGTGWVLSERLMITNHHVVEARKDGEPPASEADFVLQGAHTRAIFDYDDEALPGVEVELARVEAWSDDLDYAILRAADPLPQPPLARAPELLVTGPDGYVPVNIVQHPNGRPKMAAIRNNLVAQATARDVRYFTDTLGGSSGSPVFDDSWRVVALHRGSNLDKDKVVFQGRQVVWVNYGTQIAAILDHLEGANAALQREVVGDG